MSRPVNPIICDGCKKTKGKSDAWWTGRSYAGPAFTIVAGTLDAVEGFPPTADLCGQECVLRWVSEKLRKQANG